MFCCIIYQLQIVRNSEKFVVHAEIIVCQSKDDYQTIVILR